MFPAFNAIPLSLNLPGTGVEHWTYPVAIGEYKEGITVFARSWAYKPSVIEWLIALLPFGLVVFVTSLATRLYSFLPEDNSLKKYGLN